MNRVIILAISDIEADQRVQKLAGSISQMGNDVVIVGYMRPLSRKDYQSPYTIVRFHLGIVKGPLFYLLFNLRSLFYLLFHKSHAVVACDTDTLLAARLAKLIKRFRLIFDAHELFVDLPELIGKRRFFARSMWRFVERSCIPGVNAAITVSDGVAEMYHKRYGVPFTVIRNVPLCSAITIEHKPDSNIVIYQGAINVGRGLELLCDAMQYLAEAELWIVGTGELDSAIALLAKPLVEAGRIKILGRIAPDELRYVTAKASVGVSLEEDMGLSYHYCLPNKLFDYIVAGVPVVVSDLPEMRKLVEHYQIGEVLKERTPEALAAIIRDMLTNAAQKKQWQQNLRVAATDLCWEKEQEKLFRLWKQSNI